MRQAVLDKILRLKRCTVVLTILCVISFVSFSWAEQIWAPRQDQEAKIVLSQTTRAVSTTAQPTKTIQVLAQAFKETSVPHADTINASPKVAVNNTDSAAENFFYRCAGCHTVGGGPLTGPDLSTSSKWSDSDLGAAIKRMEKNVGPLSAGDISQMIEFLKDPNAADRIVKQKERTLSKLRSSLPPASFEKGQKYFRGQLALENGGPSCISCHHFVYEGGSLGLDLSQVKDRISGVVLQSAIQNSSYKIMRSIYEKKKITEQEALHLSEYLSHPERVKARFAPSLRWVVGLSLGGFVAFFVLLWMLDKNRKGPTRKNFLKKYLKG